MALEKSGARWLAGQRAIEYDLTDAAIDASGVAGSAIEALGRGVKNKPVESAGSGLGWLGSIMEAGSYGYEWIFTHQYQVEEAVFNHFDRDVWFSDTRDTVDHKFAYAMSAMTALILEGKVEVRQASDMFKSWKFEDYGGISGVMAYQDDPLSGGKKFFHERDYYFSILDCGAEGAISKIELTLTDPNLVW
jgi:hypothetical protein